MHLPDCSFITFRAPGGELFDYLTRVVTISEKETRQVINNMDSPTNITK